MNKALVFFTLFILTFLVVAITSISRIAEIEKNKPTETKIVSSVIDSVWFTSPGQENTLQTDYRYYAKTANGQVVVSTNRAFLIGDSIVCIYYRYENTKKEKK